MTAAVARRRQPSLRRVLLVWLLLPVLVLVPLTAVLVYLLALRPALDGLDRALTANAVALAQIIEVREGGVTLPLSAQTERALQADLVDTFFFAVGDPQGRLLGGTPELLLLAPVLAVGQWRFFEGELSGRPVRVAAHAVACGPAPAQSCVILVAETVGKRDAAESAVLLAAALGALALALPLVLLAMVAVSRGLRPLRVAAAEVDARSPDRLEALDVREVPQELLTFVNALNALFERLREAAAAQRAFVADAAHQLRTPLTVLRVEAALALDTPHPPAMRPVLQRLHAAAERGARLAQQLLALARAEGAVLETGRRRAWVDLARLATDAADHWLPPAVRADQDLGFDLAPAWVAGDPMLLEELMGNLVDNAVQHAGPGARITVRTSTQDGRALLCVEDDGRGLGSDEHPLVWQRFHRGREAAGTGSGLGLAIVKDIARLHGASATLEHGEQGRGLRVRILFPAAMGVSGVSGVFGASGAAAASAAPAVPTASLAADEIAGDKPLV